MSNRALGIYREPEFSPGKVEADAAILDATLAELKHEGVEIAAMDAVSFASGAPIRADLVLPMCQGPRALKRLAEVEQAGAVAINSALSIRNCYRDLLASGLERAGVPTPAGALVPADERLDARKLAALDLSAGVFVKRGDLHALAPQDVQRAANRAEVESILADFARRGVHFAYVQQEVAGRVVKFYGVGGGAHFSVHPEGEEVAEASVRALSEAACAAASALGLEAWGGDAVLSGDRFAIIDFNDWPSYSRVRAQAARAIARRAISLLGARARVAPEIQTRNRTAIN
jgi:glutathione synthase/RimK-type ligase-like ATP-grasp enzyme